MTQATEPRRPMNVHCGLCGHEWTACWLPMEAGKCCKVLLSAHCPMCGAAPSKIRMGQPPGVGSAVRWQASDFGSYAVYPTPPGCNVVVLAVTRHQLEPLKVLLPHQIYEEEVGKLLADPTVYEVAIIPYRSTDVVFLKRGDLVRPKTPANEGTSAEGAVG
jgi:hypothetical protein